jgi:hypothetical protein
MQTEMVVVSARTNKSHHHLSSLSFSIANLLDYAGQQTQRGFAFAWRQSSRTGRGTGAVIREEIPFIKKVTPQAPTRTEQSTQKPARLTIMMMMPFICTMIISLL